MRILTRYILWEVISHALLGGVLFTFVLFMRDLGQILDLVVRDNAPLISVLQVFVYTLPNTLTVTLPMATLVGILLGLSRMAADSEIIAMRTAGIGVGYFVRILATVGCLACALALLNTLWIAPRATEALLRLENSLKTTQASFEVQPRVFYEDFHNYVLYVQDIRPPPGIASWRKVFLADLSAARRPAHHHRRASHRRQPPRSGRCSMRLRNGAEHDTSTTDPNQYTISTFADTELPIQFQAAGRHPASAAPTPPSSPCPPANISPARTSADGRCMPSSSRSASPIPSPASCSCSSACRSACLPAAAAKARASSSPSSSSSSITFSPPPASPSHDKTKSLRGSASGPQTLSSPSPAFSCSAR